MLTCFLLPPWLIIQILYMDTLIYTIDANEEQHVAVIDLPSAFLSAENPNLVHMVLEKKLVKLIAIIEPTIYWK